MAENLQTHIDPPGRDDGPEATEGPRGLPPGLFREVVEQTPMAVSVTDRKAGILYVNSAFEALTGYSRVEITGANESILSNRATPREVYQDLWRTISNKRHWSGVLVNRKRSGEEYLAELNVAPVLDEAGEITHFLGLHRDISEVHRLGRQNLHQQALLETVLDAAPVAVALVDTEGRVILQNQEYQRLAGDLRGREPFACFREALEGQAGIDLDRACDLQYAFRNREVRLDTVEGARWFACSGAWVCGNRDRVADYFEQGEQARPCFLLLANDVTARKREVEQARLEHLRASLAEEQLSAGMREALNAALFQLQGPMNVIEAALGMLDSGAANPMMLRPMLQEILASGRQTVETLHAALPEQAPWAEEPVNLNEVLHEVLQLSAGRLLASGVVVDWRPETVLPSVTGNKGRLRTLFSCLIDNALLALGETRGTAREVRIVTRALGDAVVAEIEDNGPGISPERRLRVFEPFYCGWRNCRGRAGMGLVLAQEIASSHGGGVSIDDRCREGCRVRVELPVNRPESFL